MKEKSYAPTTDFRHMLIREIERFLKSTGMPPTKFGRLAAQDPRLVGEGIEEVEGEKGRLGISQAPKVAAIL